LNLGELFVRELKMELLKNISIRPAPNFGKIRHKTTQCDNAVNDSSGSSL
jgi:hypothetical protein